MGVGRYLNLSDAESRALQAGATALLVPIKPQPELRPDELGKLWVWNPFKPGCGGVVTWEDGLHARREEEFAMFAPLAPGDTMHLREAWAAPILCNHMRASELDSWRGCWYRCDPPSRMPLSVNDLRWRSAQHMPAWAVRHHYTVKAVSAIRVSEIREADALACGFEPAPVHGKWVDPAKGRMGHWSARKPLHDWWQSRYPKLPWESSWAWKVEVVR